MHSHLFSASRNFNFALLSSTSLALPAFLTPSNHVNKDSSQLFQPSTLDLFAFIFRRSYLQRFTCSSHLKAFILICHSSFFSHPLLGPRNCVPYLVLARNSTNISHMFVFFNFELVSTCTFFIPNAQALYRVFKKTKHI